MSEKTLEIIWFISLLPMMVYLMVMFIFGFILLVPYILVQTLFTTDTVSDVCQEYIDFFNI